MSERLRVIGTSFRKTDGMSKAIGRTMFADDLVLPGMLHARILRSTRPHAWIRRVDTSRALRHPGVMAVLTGESLPIKFGILPVSQDEHALAIDRVRYVGDPVAAVAAVDEDTADEAIRRIEVEYEDLPAIMSFEDAVRMADTRIHEDSQQGNLQKTVAMQFGEPDRAIAEADLAIEGLYFYEGNTHLPIEQHAAVALFDGDGKLTLWSSTQTPHYVHRALAKVLQLRPSCVRVIATPNGGGFGGKSDPFSHEIVVSKLSMMTGRPVKIALTREEVFYCHRGRHPVTMWVRCGFTKEGKIAGLRFRTYLDGGAHGSYGVASTYYTGALQTVTYKVPAYAFEGARAFTNKPPCGPKRGHGTPQPRFALEIHMDKAAERLGIDPIELRRRNLVESYSLTANWLRIGSCGLSACMDAVERGSAWKERYGKLPPGHGLGFAVSSYLSGAGLPIYWNDMPHSAVQLKLDRSGLVTAFCGAIDIGQGSDTVLAGIIAEILGIDPIRDIRLVMADTDLTPVDLGSYSSRVTLMMGNAAIQAAEQAKGNLIGPVSKKLGIPKDRLVFAEGRVFDAEAPEKGCSFAEAVQIGEAALGSIGSMGSYVPPKSPGRYKGAGVGPSPAYSYTACVVEAKVDLNTGWIEIPKIWIGHDVGRSIHKALVIGQIEGGVYMALGEALMEEQAFRRNVHKIPSMLDYKTPTTLDMPEVVTYLVEDPDPHGPFGAKEAGQGPLLPVPPAIANAVYNAVGVRIDELPITPEKVLKGLDAIAKGRPGRIGPSAVPRVEFPAPLRVKTPWEGGDGTAVAPETQVYRGQPS